MAEFGVRTGRREELVDITGSVAEVVRASGVTEGIAVVFCPHTTAGITINEGADPNVTRDILDGLGKLIPQSWPWRHSEGNSDAHVKASLIGMSATIPVQAGGLALGTWQTVYLCEFDGPRTRHVNVVVQGG